MELSVAKSLAQDLMKIHCPEDWKFEWDFGKKRLGCCHYRTKSISLSKYYVKLNTVDLVKDTILHECAHVQTKGHHHDRVWQSKCVELGCVPKRAAKVVISPPPNYIFICPNCNSESGYYRKQRVATACGKCCEKYSQGKYDEQFKLVQVK